MRIRRVGASPAHLNVAQVSTKDKGLILNVAPRQRAATDKTSDYQLFSQQLYPRLRSCVLSKLTLNTASLDGRKNVQHWLVYPVPWQVPGSYHWGLLFFIVGPHSLQLTQAMQGDIKEAQDWTLGSCQAAMVCTCFMSQKFGIATSPAQCLSLVNR